ncbi:MAG: hypothetical protein ABIH74_02305 [Candidatus Omnitrophota bacterium]
MITNKFSPGGTIQRGRKMADRVIICRKYGWETIVLAPLKRDLSVGKGEDLSEFKIHCAVNNRRESIMGQEQTFIENEKTNQNATRIFKDAIKKFSPFLLFPDGLNRYIFSIYRKAREIIAQEKIDAFYTMCMPVSLHIVGLLLKKSTKLPWLAEFRDAWVKNPNRFDGEAGFVHKYLEKQVVRSCDKVVWNYGVQIPPQYFESTYQDQPKSKFEQLPSPGFDGFYFEKYASIKPIEFDRFTITYAGNFYKALTPEAFFKGLKLFIDENKVGVEDMRVNFFGDWSTEFSDDLKKLGLTGFVRYLGKISYEECLKHLLGSSVNLLIIRRASGDELNVPSKMTDYIFAGKPILTIAKQSWEAAKYVRNNRLGVVADPDNNKEIADAIRHLYSSYKNGDKSSFPPDRDFVENIDSTIIMKRYCSFLDEILQNE